MMCGLVQGFVFLFESIRSFARSRCGCSPSCWRRNRRGCLSDVITADAPSSRPRGHALSKYSRDASRAAADDVCECGHVRDEHSRHRCEIDGCDCIAFERHHSALSVAAFGDTPAFTNRRPSTSDASLRAARRKLTLDREVARLVVTASRDIKPANATERAARGRSAHVEHRAR